MATSVEEYVPASQLSQVSWWNMPGVVENLPAPHATHDVSALAATVLEYFPATHCKQLSMDEDAKPVEYVPAIQFRQNARPDATSSSE